MANQNSAKYLFSVTGQTATPTAVTVENRECRGGLVIIRVSSGTSLSITPTISGYDPVSGQTWTILAGAAITGTGTVVLRVYPGLTPSANLIASDVLPVNFQVSMAHGNANAANYTVTFLGVQ